ncbi:MAG: endonuclease/exonuclease/phosphatase family protein [Acidimicrobiia bacterium]
MIDYDPGYGPLVETRVRIATWNLWARYGPWEGRAPVILETLRALDADIVGLQEVWDDGQRNQAEELATALGYEAAVWAPNLTFPDGVRAGNAVIARWPIVRNEMRELPRAGAGATDDEGEERVVVFAEVDGPRGPIQIFCAHLSWRDDHSGVRQEQVRALCELVRDCRPRTFPAVVVGDLNSEPDSDEIRMLTGLAAVPVPGVVFRDTWRVANGDAPGHTVSNDNPFDAANLFLDQRIDYVLAGVPKLGGVGHARSCGVFGNAPSNGMWPSDHFGVVAELRY